MDTDTGYIVETTGSGRTYEEQPDGSFLDVTDDWFNEQLREVKASLATWDEDRLNAARYEVNKGRHIDEWV